MSRLLALIACLLVAAPAAATEAGWALLREGGRVVLLRHAQVTGTHDSANVDAEDCSTQRNLSERGRQQARKIGSLFATRAAPIDRILSSRYCRAFDTGRIAFRDNEIEKTEALDPPPADEAGAAARKEAMMEIIRDFNGSGNLVLITHLENIVALTGATAREGEAVIVAPQGEGLHVMGRIIFN